MWQISKCSFCFFFFLVWYVELCMYCVLESRWTFFGWNNLAALLREVIWTDWWVQSLTVYLKNQKNVWAYLSFVEPLISTWQVSLRCYSVYHLPNMTNTSLPSFVTSQLHKRWVMSEFQRDKAAYCDVISSAARGFSGSVRTDWSCWCESETVVQLSCAVSWCS